MAVEFHDGDETCAPFPHRVIIIIAKEVMIRGKLSWLPEQRFIICAQCDHWILANTDCPCDYLCHDLGQLIASLECEKRAENVTNL